MTGKSNEQVFSAPLSSASPCDSADQFSLNLNFRDERIVHVNVGWVGYTGFSAVECEGRTLSSFMDQSRDIASGFGYKHFLHVIANLKAMTPIPEVEAGSVPGTSSDQPRRDAHSPSSYETSNIYLVKKARAKSHMCKNFIYGSDYPPSSSPHGVESLIPSPFGSPTITRKSSINLSSDSGEIRWDSFRVPSTSPPGLRTQLSTVPIGLKHFAVLCIPAATS